jgi:hypothetical protein
LPERRILVHTSLQPIGWGDMDTLGHLNHTVCFRCMEQARIEWRAAPRGGPCRRPTRSPRRCAPPAEAA